MKNILIVMTLLIMASCGVKKNVSSTTTTVASDCPKDGDCTIEVFDGKSMVVKTSETRSLYYDLEDAVNKKVIKYTYNRKVKGDLQDASYREEIVFEIPSGRDELVFNDAGLRDAQLLFGRFCYCKGQTGYYIIEHGSLKVIKEKNSKTTEISLDFSTKQVPQILKEVSFSIK